MAEILTAESVGLCSVTLRGLGVDEVLTAASAAGLCRVEWGADVHAPPDRPGVLAHVRDASADAGLAICSYGSYWRAGVSPLDAMRDLVAAAHTLGTGRIRIWAGGTGSGQADRDAWAGVVQAAQEAAAIAADGDVGLAFEFHGDTLTDTVAGTLQLLERVDRPSVSTYWQPPVGVGADLAVEGLRALLDRVSAVHVFSWWPGTHRLPLAERAELWRAVTDLLAARGVPTDLLLEFVPDDDPALLGREAETVRGWIARVPS